MKNLKRFISALLVVCLMAVCFAGCQQLPVETTGPAANPTNPAPTTPNDPADPTDPEPTEWVDPLVYAEGTELRIAAGYQKVNQAISFSADIAGEGITLADGVTYHTGDLKPTWAEVEKILNVKLVDKFTGAGSDAKEFAYWAEQLQEIDIITGDATSLAEYGENGQIVNLMEYIDMMPNFKAYLEANPIVQLSITANISTGAIYFAPYSDGMNDIERMPLMRTDWVVKLLDGEGDFAVDASHTVVAGIYTPYMPTSGKVTVDVVSLDGTKVETVTKDYDAAGNIVELMNNAGTIDGVTAVNMLRDYIDAAYNGYYGTTRSNLFVGQNAAWDADELVALLRCVVANPQTLNGTDNVEGLFSREDNNVQRQVDMFRFCGHLFGVRGMESRQDFLYVGNDNELHDARQEEATYIALERMHAMAQEGLISQSFMEQSESKTETMLENDLGFMHYDYNQTQTAHNRTKLDTAAGEKYMAVMVPVARWYDGSNADGVYMRFTESWRSVKTNGWGISVAGVGEGTDKLYAALKLFDYAYSPEGQILMSYGPDAFIKTNDDGSYVTFNFNGEQWPVIADATYDELISLAGGNYTNYARRYLGSCLSFAKSQSFEYQCTHEVGKEGAAYISNAIGLGTIKHPELGFSENAWYTSVPSVLPNTPDELAMIKSYTELSDNFGTAKQTYNIWLEQIRNGYTLEGMGSAAETAAKVAKDWNGSKYLALKNDAYDLLFDAAN